MYRDKVYREARRTMADAENVKIFFKGVNDTDSVKKRYKDLLKIYHPDNTHGDNNIVLAINEEYERLLRFYLWGHSGKCIVTVIIIGFIILYIVVRIIVVYNTCK